LILVTGTTGFIGTALTAELRRRGIAFRHALHSPAVTAEPSVVVGDIGPSTDWSAAVSGAGIVIHLAGRAHTYGHTPEHRAKMFDVNAGATGALARASLREGVKRFILLSSTKVNGDISPLSGFREDDPPHPADDYGQSKLAGEEEVRSAGENGLPHTIIRTPLVYGAGVKANFLSLMRAIDRGRLLPLGAITENRRTLIYVENLVSAILHVFDPPAAVGETFLVGDDERVSTRELATRLGTALNRPPRLIPVPVPLLKLAGAATGRRDSVMRLTESSVVDATKIRTVVGWQPPLSMDEGLRRTAQWFCMEDRRSRLSG
jgi:nucleoside-diphosphate-sugar epimerase